MAANQAELTQDQIDKLSEMNVDLNLAKKMLTKFRVIDRNNSNFIEKDEVITLLQACGQNPTMKEAEDLVLNADTNEDGKIDFIEFVRLSTKHHKTPAQKEDDVKKAFQEIEKNAEKKPLTREELKNILTSLGDRMTESEVENMLNLLEFDDDIIDYENFIKMASKEEDENETDQIEDDHYENQ